MNASIAVEHGAAVSFRGRIRSVLQTRNAIRLGELCRHLSAPSELVRAELARMVESGEVEIIRPVDYKGDDLDSYWFVRAGCSSWIDD
jgi:FeoC like transcriptional regulator